MSSNLDQLVPDQEDDVVSSSSSAISSGPEDEDLESPDLSGLSDSDDTDEGDEDDEDDGFLDEGEYMYFLSHSNRTKPFLFHLEG